MMCSININLKLSSAPFKIMFDKELGPILFYIC